MTDHHILVTIDPKHIKRVMAKVTLVAEQVLASRRCATCSYLRAGATGAPSTAAGARQGASRAVGPVCMLVLAVSQNPTPLDNEAVMDVPAGTPTAFRPGPNFGCALWSGREQVPESPQTQQADQPPMSGPL